MRKINVLSCFDGMSCGQIALQRAGIPVNKYYASEIDKYAIKVTQYHFPDTVQLGSIENWKEWIDELGTIDLLIGGSPCQGFSNAGLGLNFDDPRSKLFFIFVDIRNYLLQKNPELRWMLENVKMKKQWEQVITEQMGTEPVLIDSALVSAQSRKRLYWANFPISQPEDRHIYLKDIIETGEVDRDKSYAIDANYYKGGNPRLYFEDGRRQLAFERQSHRRAMVKVGVDFAFGLEEGRRLDDGKSFSRNYREGYRVYSSEGKASTLSAQPKGGPGGHTGLYITTPTRYVTRSGKEIKKDSEKSGTLREAFRIKDNYAVDDGISYRKLTPVECERLQTVEDNWTSMVSNTQRYKMLGNGWTIEVIAHIFRKI